MRRSIPRFFLIIILILVLLFGSLNTNTAAEDGGRSIDTGAIDQFVLAKMKALNIPGLALGIVKEDSILYLQGYGDAGPGKGQVTPQTPFIIGSLSKSFTALSTMKLVENEMVDLDATVRQYLPWFSLADAKMAGEITIRNLLNQTSGIPGSAGGYDFTTEGKSIEKFVRELTNVKLTKPIGSEFQYSEANYVILAAVIEQVSGLKYNEYLKQNIFNLIDMKHSYASNTVGSDDLATGHRIWYGFPVKGDIPYADHYVPSSYIISSAEDMANYIKLFINGGVTNGKEILSASGVEEMLNPAIPFPHVPGYSYGMGWYVGPEFIEHPGNLASYHADMILIPKSKTGIVVLMNINNKMVFGEFANIVAYGIRDMVLGREGLDKIPSYKNMYLVINLVSILAVMLLTLRLFLVIRKLRRKFCSWKPGLVRSIILPFVISLLVPASLLIGIPGIYGYSLAVVWFGQPDITLVLIICSILVFATGAIKGVTAIIKTRKTAATHRHCISTQK